MKRVELMLFKEGNSLVQAAIMHRPLKEKRVQLDNNDKCIQTFCDIRDGRESGVDDYNKSSWKFQNEDISVKSGHSLLF